MSERRQAEVRRSAAGFAASGTSADRPRSSDPQQGAVTATALVEWIHADIHHRIAGDDRVLQSESGNHGAEEPCADPAGEAPGYNSDEQFTRRWPHLRARREWLSTSRTVRRPRLSSPRISGPISPKGLLQGRPGRGSRADCVTIPAPNQRRTRSCRPRAAPTLGGCAQP
jgi:hypothetical protein